MLYSSLRAQHVCTMRLQLTHDVRGGICLHDRSSKIVSSAIFFILKAFLHWPTVLLTFSPHFHTLHFHISCVDEVLWHPIFEINAVSRNEFLYLFHLSRFVWYPALLLAFISCAFNPIIYCFLSKNFRKAFKSILCCANLSNILRVSSSAPTSGTPAIHRRTAGSYDAVHV